MANSDRLSRALRTLGERFPPPTAAEPSAAPPGTENLAADQRDARPVPTVPTVPRENEITARHDADAWAGWEERVAILEYEGGFDRPEAEARATAELGYRPSA